jgi:hypothetical protein
MTTCNRPGTFVTSLACVRPAGHLPGCSFVASSGSHVDDHHADGGHG